MPDQDGGGAGKGLQVSIGGPAEDGGLSGGEEVVGRYLVYARALQFYDVGLAHGNVLFVYCEEKEGEEVRVLSLV